MPRGDKSSYSDKQKRQADRIEEGYEHRGVSKKEAERRAWATVNKETGGGNKSGSGRGVPDTNVSSKRGGRIGGPRGGKAAGRGTIALRQKSGRNPQAKRDEKVGRAQDRAQEVTFSRDPSAILRPSLRAQRSNPEAVIPGLLLTNAPSRNDWIASSFPPSLVELRRTSRSSQRRQIRICRRRSSAERHTGPDFALPSGSPS